MEGHRLQYSEEGLEGETIGHSKNGKVLNGFHQALLEVSPWWLKSVTDGSQNVPDINYKIFRRDKQRAGKGLVVLMSVNSNGLVAWWKRMCLTAMTATFYWCAGLCLPTFFFLQSSWNHTIVSISSSLPLRNFSFFFMPLYPLPQVSRTSYIIWGNSFCLHGSISD